MWPFRQKKSLDYILQIIRLSKRLVKEVEVAERTGNPKKVLKFLYLFRKFDKAEFHKIKEETGSEHLMEECIIILKLIEEAIKEMEDFSKFDKAKETINRIIQLETLIEKEILEKTHNLDKYEMGRLMGVGGNSHCYEIKGHPDLVMITLGSTGFGTGSKEQLRAANELMLIHRKIPSEVHIARILEIGIRDGLVATIMEKARGHPLHDRNSKSYATWSKRLRELASVPQSHFNKLILDLNVLHRYGLMIDPSKPDNIFYDTHFGFTFIDLDPGRYIGSLEVPLIHTYNLFTRHKTRLRKADAINIKTIMEKLRQAGDIYNEYYYSQINNAIQKFLS